MAKVFRQQIDEGILERAAALFARHGFSQTSVQAVADAVGMSKAGLLHYFPTKDALHDAVVTRSAALAREVLAEVDALAIGPERDRRAIETLVDQAIARPGMVAYLVGINPDAGGDRINAVVLEVFGVEPAGDPARLLRVLGALGALSMTVLAAHRAGKALPWRAHVVATSLGALSLGG